MRVKKTRIDAILSCYNLTEDKGLQNDIIEEWGKKASRVIVVGRESPKAIETAGIGSGYDFVPSKDQTPSIVEALDYYQRKGGPEEAVILCAPNCIIESKQEQLFDFILNAQMQRAWAGFINTSPYVDSAPEAFVVSGHVLQYLLKDIPDTLTFVGSTWSRWVANWFKTHLNPSRYFNATDLRLVGAVPSQQDVVAVAVDTVASAIEQRPVESKVKRKAGRPKKEPVAA